MIAERVDTVEAKIVEIIGVLVQKDGYGKILVKDIAARLQDTIEDMTSNKVS